MSAWLSAFALTQLVEVPIYLRALLQPSPGAESESEAEDQTKPQRSLAAALALAFAASAITHPVVWFVMPKLVPGSWLRMVLVAESFAILTEAAWLRAFGLRRALAWAGLANAASVLVGLGLRRVFGWP